MAAVGTSATYGPTVGLSVSRQIADTRTYMAARSIANLTSARLGS